MGRGYGVPQGPQGSDLFANLYLNVVDRQLLRARIPFDRHVDDYLLRSSSLPDARRHLLTLEASLRGIGLILNRQETQVLHARRTRPGSPPSRDSRRGRHRNYRGAGGLRLDPDAFADVDLSNAKQEPLRQILTALNGDEEKAFKARRRMIDKALPYLAASGARCQSTTWTMSSKPLDRRVERAISICAVSFASIRQSMVEVVGGVSVATASRAVGARVAYRRVGPRGRAPLGATPWLLAVVRRCDQSLVPENSGSDCRIAHERDPQPGRCQCPVRGLSAGEPT